MKYYWTVFLDTGEVAESGTAYRTVEKAHRAGLKSLKDTWDYVDRAEIEVWDFPSSYSGLDTSKRVGEGPVSRKEYVREGYSPLHLREVIRTLGGWGMTEEELLEEMGPWDQGDDWRRTGWVEQ